MSVKGKMANKKLYYLFLFVTWNALSHITNGYPVTTAQTKQLGLYNFLKADCLRLIRLIAETKRQFVDIRFRDNSYDHYYHFNGIAPVMDFTKLTKKAFLKKNIELFYALLPLVTEMKNDEQANPGPGHFVDKFKQINEDTRDLIVVLQEMEKVLQFHITRPRVNSQPTLKPTATQKEKDERKLAIMKELFMSIVTLQAGAPRLMTS